MLLHDFSVFTLAENIFKLEVSLGLPHQLGRVGGSGHGWRCSGGVLCLAHLKSGGLLCGLKGNGLYGLGE